MRAATSADMPAAGVSSSTVPATAMLRKRCLRRIRQRHRGNGSENELNQERRA